MGNPRIYITIATFYPLVGGAETQALAQGRSLRERGYSTTIVTFHHNSAWAAREVIEGVPIIRVAGTLLGDREKLPRILQQLFYLMAMMVMGWTLWRHRQQYDILHVYHLGFLTLPTSLVCLLTGKPMIVAVRSAGSGEARISLSKASLVAGPLDASAQWLQVNGHVKLGSELEDLERFGRLTVRFTHFLLRRIHAVVVVLSSRMKGYLAAHNFSLPDVQLIPNGVDISRFYPNKGNDAVNERAQVVVCISSLKYEKGIDVLLQAWHLVHEQLPQAYLILVGNGHLLAQLERMAKALDIAESVEFAGVQSDITAHLHRGNVAVLPSRWEGMPNAVLELMACGLPCVATRVSGSEDIIQHGVNGLLVEPEDFQGLAEALLTLLRDPEIIEKYGHAARSTIEQHYSLEDITARYIELYQRIMDHTIQIAEDISSTNIHQLSS